MSNMDDSVHFSLTNFQNHVTSTFDDIRSEEIFADVTLVSDDQVKMPAHRIVISASSPVLKSLLLMNPTHSHPLIYLRGIKTYQLQSILQFMYKGETSVHQDHVEDFINIATDLQIKELTNNFKDTQNIKQAKDTQGLQAQSLITQTQKLSNKDNNELSVSAENLDIIDMTVKMGMDFNNSQKNCLEDQSLGRNVQNVIDENIVGSSESKDNILLSEGSIQCQDCNLVFKSKPGLRLHRSSVHEGVRYFCNECDFQGTTQFKLKIHRQSQHEGLLNSCDKCEYKAVQRSSLKIHHKFKHEGIRYPCKECEFQGSCQGTLNRHHRQKHEDFVYHCDQCDYQTRSSDSLNIHKQVKHLGKRYSCEQCKFQSASKYKLQDHIKVKHDGNVYSCEQCDYQSSRRDGLKSHQRTKHDGILYYCDQCDFKGMRASNLKRHQESVHACIDYFCDQCDYKTLHNGDLEKHVTSCHKSIKEETM